MEFLTCSKFLPDANIAKELMNGIFPQVASPAAMPVISASAMPQSICLSGNFFLNIPVFVTSRSHYQLEVFLVRCFSNGFANRFSNASQNSKEIRSRARVAFNIIIQLTGGLFESDSDGKCVTGIYVVAERCKRGQRIVP